ncbi:polyprenyl synthetase family protein [Robiginitalea sp. IMCC44478]|uniref:polyprenyl synthetase family protein n=1 Tax=Robiginitalea sp. IMCC44478 TaxID=3459122 RepID=UPI004043831D
MYIYPMTESLKTYRQAFDAYMDSAMQFGEPRELYNPISYILDLGGKRIRPLLVLLAADLYGNHSGKALPAAAAVEVFHNFSLIHDDIMDQAPIRRGQPTVHKKWNTNTAILSGDAMLVKAYQQLQAFEPSLFKPLVEIFSKTALEVCEGQQYDMDFESREDVTIPEYLHMIEYKTAVLVGCALKMGAMVAGAGTTDQEALYAYGLYLGLAFQLQDDYLDVFGNPENFGKQVGGDIIENKKTYLYLRARELGSQEVARELLDLYSIQPRDPASKIKRVSELFDTTGAKGDTRNKIEEYTQQAFKQLELLNIPQAKREQLHEFGNWLLKRDY